MSYDGTRWLRHGRTTRDDITAGATQAEIATSTGIEQSSIFDGGKAVTRRAPNSSSRSHGSMTATRSRPSIVAGYLDRNEVGGVIELETCCLAVSTDQLLDELSRRFATPQRRAAAAPAERGQCLAGQLDRPSLPATSIRSLTVKTEKPKTGRSGSRA